MMTAKENMIRTIKFQNPGRVALNLPDTYGNDFSWIGMTPDVDSRPGGKGVNNDEWGAVWENIGVCRLGEVKESPLKDWNDFDKLKIPDVDAEFRWQTLQKQIADADKTKFLLCSGVSLYERIHFIRGLENTWADIYLEPENLQKLIGILVDMNLKAIKHYAAVGADGLMFCDDWGLQNRLMISPDKWREFWKPAYTKVYKAAHDAGILTFLHSCGYILEILDDLIEAGLDVIQLDQQMNMGLDNLRRYTGKITFWCPVDIQAVMPHGSMEEIRKYCHELFGKLATPHGGFIAQWYGDPKGAGHSQEAIDVMCQEFLTLDYRKIRD
jgi:uroporphyrinogen decarboxylase